LNRVLTGVFKIGFTGVAMGLTAAVFCAVRVVLLDVAPGVTVGLETAGLDVVGLVMGVLEGVAAYFEGVEVSTL
jgi:hypothetical protein